MSIDNRYSTKLLLENYSKNKIIINSTNNENLELNSDVYGNILNGDLVFGNQIIACGKFDNMTSGLLLFTNDDYCLINGLFDLEQSITQRSIFLQQDAIEYRINAYEENLQFDGSVATFTTFVDTTHDIYKVFLNGKETTNYTISASSLTFGSGTNIFYNSVSIVYYEKNQTLTIEEIELYVYLPYQLYNEDLQFNIDISNGFTFTYASNVLTFASTGLLDIIPNIDGVPTTSLFICYEDEYRLIQLIEDTQITVYEPFTKSGTNEILKFTPYMLFTTVDSDFNDSTSNEYYTYEDRFNKFDINKKIKNRGNISISYYNQRIYENYLDLPSITGDIKNWLLFGKQRVSKYKENTMKFEFYTNCELIQGTTSTSGITEVENVTFNYLKKVGEL